MELAIVAEHIDGYKCTVNNGHQDRLRLGVCPISDFQLSCILSLSTHSSRSWDLYITDTFMVTGL